MAQSDKRTARTPRGIVILVAVAAVVTVAAVAVAPLAAASNHTDPPPADETFEVGSSGDVDVRAWDRAILTLRADTDDAAVTVDNADWSIRNADGDETNLNRDPIGVFDVGDPVTLEFDEAMANKGGLFGDSEVEVIRAHVEETENATVPTSFSNALETLAADGANENASFTSLGTYALEDGSLAFEDTPEESGHYLYFVVVEDGDGFAVSDGELSVESPSTVVGVEHVAVRAGSAEVDVAPTVSAGTNATFSVDASDLAGESVTTAVVLYDERTFVEQFFVVNVTGDVDRDFSIANDTRLETSVATVDGVATVEDDLDRFGVDLDDGSVARSADLGAILDFVAERAGAEESADVESTEDVTLSASMTVANLSGGDGTVDVGTAENWSSGRYRWVAVAVGENSSQLAVETGELTINQGQGQGPPDEAEQAGVGGMNQEASGNGGAGVEPDGAATAATGPGFGGAQLVTALVALVGVFGLLRRR